VWEMLRRIQRDLSGARVSHVGGAGSVRRHLAGVLSRLRAWIRARYYWTPTLPAAMQQRYRQYVHFCIQHQQPRRDITRFMRREIDQDRACALC